MAGCQIRYQPINAGLPNMMSNKELKQNNYKIKFREKMKEKWQITCNAIKSASISDKMTTRTSRQLAYETYNTYVELFI